MCTTQFPIESPLIKQTIGLLIRREWDFARIVCEDMKSEQQQFCMPNG